MKNQILDSFLFANKIMPPPVKRLTGFAKMFALSIILLAYACHKDYQSPVPEYPQPAGKPNYPITLFEAMASFAELQDAPASSFSGDNDFIKLEPVWSQATLDQSQSGKEIVVVPLADSSLRVLNDGRVDARLLFSKDGPDEITAEVVMYIADSTYYYSKNQTPEFEDFTGVYAFFDIGLNFKYGIAVDSGLPVGKVDSVFRNTTSGSANYRDNTPNEDCFTQIHTVIIFCPQAYASCFDIMWVVTVVCDSGPGGGNTGGSNPGGTTGGTTGGTNNGNGNTGGTSNNDPYGTFWDVFFGRLPMGIFTQSPSQLPPGFDTVLVKKFVNVHAFFRFTPKQLQDLQKRPDFIAVLHDVYAEWFDVSYDPEQPDGRPDFALAKPVLDFAVKHSLTAQQFEALLRNGAMFEQVKSFEEQNSPLSEKNEQFMMLHLSLILESSEYEHANISEGYPQLGSDNWVNTLDFGNYYDVWKRLTPEEKQLCKNNIWEALLSYRNKGIAEQKTVSVMGSSGLSDHSDAFRHAYFNALNTMDFGATLTQQFADAHESQVPPQLILEKQMDMFNNAVGIFYGYTYPTSNDQMAIYIRDWALLTGQLRYLSPLDWSASPTYPLGANGIISTTQLVPTNE